MEEREPSPSNRNNHAGPPHPPPEQPEPLEIITSSPLAPQSECRDISAETSKYQFRSGTYIIQVPKDQIYRIPPPENALFAERCREQPRRETSCCRRPACLCIIGILIIVGGVILGDIAGVTTLFLKHDDPKFSIEDIYVKNNVKHHEFDISLKAENPNSHVEIVYYHEGSNASLSYQEREFGVGKFPGFDQGSKSSTIFKILLLGEDIGLPKEISRSINGTKSETDILLLLSMNVPLKLKGVFSTKRKKIHISCGFSVDTLAGNTRIKTQKCQTTG